MKHLKEWPWNRLREMYVASLSLHSSKAALLGYEHTEHDIRCKFASDEEK